MKQKKLIILCSATMLLGMISCKSATGPTAVTTNSGDQIFFEEYSDDSTQTGVHVINTDGTGDKVLYIGGNITSAPRAGKLLFTSYESSIDSVIFYLGDVNGGKAQKLFSIGDGPHFAILSPDGQKVVYDADDGLIHVFDISTHSDSKMSSQVDLTSATPVISDDSRFIYALINDPISGLFQLNDLAVIQKSVASVGVQGFIASEEHDMIDESPDGSKICFFVFPTNDSFRTMNNRLVIQDINSGMQVFDTTTYPKLDAAWGFDNAKWSPLGNKIAFTIMPADNTDFKKIVIYEVHTGKTIQFDDPMVNGEYGWLKRIDWSKDESALFLTVDKTEGESYIQKMNASTGAITTFNLAKAGQQVTIPMAFRSRDIGEH